MSKDNMVALTNPAKNVIEDQLTLFIRESAQQMLKTAIEVEAQEFVAQYKGRYLPSGQQQVVRNGYLPERTVQTGIGDIAVQLPRIRDRGTGEEPITFVSNLVPKYMRRTITIDVMLPLLYLKGISTGDFADVLKPMLGDSAKQISPKVISQLKANWLEDYKTWVKRCLNHKSYAYWWVDGIYLSARLEDAKSCVLVIVGADGAGKKELIALIDGFRESKESWKELLLDLKQRGLTQGARLAVGDGALGFWSAVSEVYPETQQSYSQMLCMCGY